MSNVAGVDALAQSIAKKSNERHQHHEAQHAAREHVGRHLWPDDVANAQHRRADFKRERAAFQTPPKVEHERRGVGPQTEDEVHDGVATANEEPQEHGLGVGATLLAHDENVGACGAFGVRELAVLLDDEPIAQRDHHQHADEAPEQSDQENACELELKAHQQQARQRERDAGGDGLASRPRGLHHVVLEDARWREVERALKPADQGDGQHGHRDRSRHREPHLEAKIDGACREDHAEQRPEQHAADGQLARALTRGDKRLKWRRIRSRTRTRTRRRRRRRRRRAGGGSTHRAWVGGRDTSSKGPPPERARSTEGSA